MAQIDYVRVVDEDGIEQSVPVKRYEAQRDLFKKVDYPGADAGGAPFPAFGPSDVPAKSASADEWREFARRHAGARGLTSEQVEFSGRDELAGSFVSSAPTTSGTAGTASTTKES